MRAPARPAAHRSSTSLAAALLGAVLSVGCDAGAPEPEAAGPSLQLVEVTATIALDDAGRPVRAALDTTTPSVVLPTTALALRFDRYLDPVDAIRQAVCIQSSTDAVEEFFECDAGVFLRPSYDPATRTLTFYQQSETFQLAPETLYRLTVYRPRPEQDQLGLRAFDGARLDRTYELTFRTAAAVAGPSEQPVVGDAYCRNEACVAACTSTDCDCPPGAREILAGCSTSGCHDPGSPALGLTLAHAQGLAATAVGTVAKGTQVGANATASKAAPPRFGTSMPIIDPGNPGNSFLLYKVLMNPGSAAGDESLASGEGERLQAYFGAGAPMPPSNIPALPQSHAEVLSAWIAAGAKTECD